MGRAFEFRKERKFKRWSAIAKTFTRLVKDVYMAVKESGPDPKNNAKLRAIIQNCKAANMPKENIERAIKKATQNENKDYKEVNYEGYIPGGIALFIQTTTDNNNRTVGNIRSYFNKVGGNLATSGSVEYLFDHYCHFTIQLKEIILDELEFSLIDFGVEHLHLNKNLLTIVGPFDQFASIQSFLENQQIDIVSSGFERIPKKQVKANQKEKDLFYKLLDKLENDQDVQQVFYNLEV